MNVYIHGTDEKSEENGKLRVEVVLSGNLDTNGSVDLQNAMSEIFKRGAGINIVIDFYSVPFMSSAGLRVLLLATKKADAEGGSLKLQNVSDSIKEVLNMIGLSSILKII